MVLYSTKKTPVILTVCVPIQSGICIQCMAPYSVFADPRPAFSCFLAATSIFSFKLLHDVNPQRAIYILEYVKEGKRGEYTFYNVGEWESQEW